METIQRSMRCEQKAGLGYVETGTVNVPVEHTWSGKWVSAVNFGTRETWNLPIARYYRRGEESHVKLATPDGSLQLLLYAGNLRRGRYFVNAALTIGNREKISGSANLDTPEIAQHIVGVFTHEATTRPAIRLTGDLTLFLEVLQDYMQELLDYAVEPVR